jgi:hypothetical protein
MSQSQCLQVKLYSTNGIQCSNVETIQKFMEENYSYKCDNFNLKAANKKVSPPGKTNVLIVRNYIPDNMKDEIVNEINKSIYNETSSKPIQINDLLKHSLPILSNLINTLDGVIECSTEKKTDFTEFDVLTQDDNGERYSGASMYIHLGSDEYPSEMKWFNKTLNKSEGRKSSFKVNKGDLIIIASEFNDDSNHSITTISGQHIKTKTKKVKQPVEKKSDVTENIVVTSEVTTTEHVSNPKIHRKIIRTKPNGKTEKVWRKSTYELKEGEQWIDFWKVNKVVFECFSEVENALGDNNDTSDNKKDVKPKKKTNKKKSSKTANKESKSDKTDKQTDLDIDTNVNDDLDKTVEELPDVLEFDLETSINSNSSNNSSVSSHVDDIELSRTSQSRVTSEQSPAHSVVSSHTSEDDDAQEIDTREITDSNELNTENYDEETERTESPNTQSSNLMINEIVNIRLALAKIPSDLKLCDEIGDRKVERMVYLLLGPKFKNISIGKEHRIGNRVYGFETDYPVYNVIPM